MAIMAKDREMEIMEDNHRVEVRVYVQKVKHLEYEHKNTLGRVESKVGPYTLLHQHTHAHSSCGLPSLAARWPPPSLQSIIIIATGQPFAHSTVATTAYPPCPCTDQNDTVRGG